MKMSLKTVASHILRVPLLRNVLWVCLAIATIFPMVSVLFIHPSFVDFLIRAAEEDAILTATHLTSTIIPEGRSLSRDMITGELHHEIERMSRDYHLERLKIFLKTGEIIYSTQAEDVGRINKERYFHDIVAGGKTYTKVIEKDTATLEGRVVKSDVVEIYVPLQQKGQFTGAFEIYYDITDRKERLDRLLYRTALIQVIIAVSLLFAILVALFSASQSIMARSSAEESLRKAHRELERRVQERTAALVAANEQLRSEIAERHAAETALRETSERLRILSSHLLTAQERERRRISLELHDELGQSLTVLKLQLRTINTRLKDRGRDLFDNCEEVLQYTDDIIENVRRLSRDLSPSILEDLGLTAALLRLSDDFGKHSKIDINLKIPDVDHLFSKDRQILIYRIFQEAFNNIGKHARATRVSAVVQINDGQIRFSIQDNGVGFEVEKLEAHDPAERSLGLMAMDERARMLDGILRIDSKPGEGTTLTLILPVSQERT